MMPLLLIIFKTTNKILVALGLQGYINVDTLMGLKLNNNENTQHRH
jgi:hypothetical protein